jgi:DUF971 family protein
MNDPIQYSAVSRATRIKLRKADKILEVDFEDGKQFAFAAELLRVESPSAEVQGHSADQKITVAGRRHVNIMNVVAVGNYAVQLTFDDLYELGCNMESRWANYLVALQNEGLSRDP